MEPVIDEKTWLQSVLHLMDLDAEIKAVQPPDPKDIHTWLEISAADLSETQLELLLGREGATLDALQFLLNTTMNLQSEMDNQRAYTLELAGYRQKRREELARIAWDAASQVRQSGEEFVFGSLSAAERRQIHVLLQDEPDLDTFSRGKEPERRLVVCLKAGTSEDSHDQAD